MNVYRPLDDTTVHPWIQNLHIGHLQLGRLPRSHRPSTIGDLLKNIQHGALSRSSAGAEVRIKRTLDSLLSGLTPGNPDGWDSFRKRRPPFRSYKQIYFASPRLRFLTALERRRSVEALHLSVRATNALRANGIVNVGQFVRRAEKGIINLSGLGSFKAAEVVESLDALAKSVERNGSINWIEFAIHQGFCVLPEDHVSPTPSSFIDHFPRICELAVSSTLGSNALRVLKSRLLLGANGHCPRRKVAHKLGQNRETIRQHEFEIVEMLRRAIWNDEYCGCRFRFRRDFLIPIFTLGSFIRRNVQATWEQALQSHWRVTRDTLYMQEVLLLRLLQLDIEVSGRSKLERKMKAEIGRLIAAKAAQSFTADWLSDRLTAKLGALTPSKDTILAALQSWPDLEADKMHSCYSVRFDRLSYTGRCERLLRQRGAPMHVGELTQRSRDADSTNVRMRQLTATLLWNSQKFVAIGKTGYWALREWPDIESRTITDIAADFMGSSGGPMSEDQIFELVRQRRVAARSSIGSLLRNDPRFVRLAPNTWLLRNQIPKKQRKLPNGSAR